MNKNFKQTRSVSSNSLKSSEDEEENITTLYDIVRDKREISDIKEEKVYETQESQEKKREPQSKRRGQQQMQSNLNAPVARLIYAAMLKENVESIKVKEIIDKLINEELLQNDDEYSSRDYQLNGFLLIKGKFFIHFIEGDTQIINQKYIKDFLYANYKELQQDDDMHGQQQSFFQQINIISFTEENPKKLFDKHYSFQDNVSPQLAADLEKTEEQIQDRTWEIYHKFCEVALKQYTKKNKSQEAKMANEFNFSNDDWSMLMMKYYMSIEDYYEMYLDDVVIQLDSEMVYPFTPSLINNLEYSERGYFQQVKP